MSCSKGRKNPSWCKEEKLRVVKRYLEGGVGRPRIAKEEGIASGQISTWIRKYLKDGEVGLENEKKTGNKFSALHISRGLSETDRLKPIIAKQEVEIVRLKKGS